MVNRLQGPRTGRDTGRKKGGFTYKPRTLDDVKKRAEQTGGTFDSIFKSGVDTYRPKNGDNTIRILPPTWDDPDHYGYEVFVHKYVGADNSTYLCPQKMLSKACPICAASKEAADAGEKEEAKALSVSKQILCYVIDRNEDDLNPVIYSMSWTMDRDIAALCYSKKTGKVLQVDNPDEGFDLTFQRTGAGLKTKYFGHVVDRDPSPVDDSEKSQEKVLSFISENPIPDMLKFYDADYLEKVINGTTDKKNDDDDTASRSSRRSRDEDEDEAPRGRRRAAADDDGEGEEEAPRSRRKPAADDDGDGEEEPPRRSRSRRDADEEADEAPRSRRRAADDDGEEEASPSRRSRARDDDGEDNDAADKPRSRVRNIRGEDEEEIPQDDDPPRSRSRSRSRDAEDEEGNDEPPPRSRRGKTDDDGEGEEEPPPRSRRKPAADDDGEEEPPRRSSRRK